MSRKLKIAIVSDAIYPYNKGGKETRIYEITTRLARLGHDIHIYCMKWWKGENNKIENGVTLHALSALYPLYSRERRSIRQGVLFGLSCLKLITEDFDVVEVDHMPFFPLFAVKIVCLIKRKPMVAVWNEVWGLHYWLEYMGKLGLCGYLIERISVYLPHSIISISEHTTSKLKHDLHALQKIITIPMGVDCEKIDFIKPSLESCDVIFAGRMLKHKNVDVLIEAIQVLRKEWPELRALLVGDGPEKQNLMDLAKARDVWRQIEFKGFLEKQSDVFALFKSAKVFVLPSTREGFGVVVIEANACGIPAIAIDHPNNAAVHQIQNEANGLVTGLTPCQIAGSIKNLIERRISPKSLIDFSKKYDWNHIALQYENFYLSL